MRAIWVMLLLCAGAWGQAPQFEVISIKPAIAGRGIDIEAAPGGRLVCTNMTVKGLIHFAYDVDNYRILNSPHWTDEDRWDIEAKPPAGSALSQFMPPPRTLPNAEMRLAMRAMLADRFGLKVHTESHPESVYALVVDKAGAKLTPAKDTTKRPHVGIMRNGSMYETAKSHAMFGQNATMAQLAQMLAQMMHRPVTDRTGLDGHYDFSVEYADDDAELSNAAPILRALPAQVGLRLESEPGSVDVLVIERVEKATGN